MQHSDKKHIILKTATRQRPAKFMKNLDNYLKLLSGKHKITVVISMDTDDILCNNPHIRKYIDGKKTDNIDVVYAYGESKGKIAAINRDIPSTSWDLLVSTCDDIEPIEQDWDDIFVTDLFREFPDSYGSINYNVDPRLGTEKFKTLIVFPVLGRKLYDKFGYILHPSYISEWCDNEQTEIFEKLGVVCHIDRRPVIHKWDENQDALMAKNMRDGAMYDRDNYHQRKLRNFDMDKLG
jgi:hypothetical protein